MPVQIDRYLQVSVEQTAKLGTPVALGIGLPGEQFEFFDTNGVETPARGQ
jgi:hypothetical protein